MSTGTQPPRSHRLCSQRRKQKPTFSIKRSSCLSNTNIDYRRSSAAHTALNITESHIYPNLSDRWNLKKPHQTGTCSEAAGGYIQHTYIPNPRWSFNFTFYSLGCRCELISDLISHVGRPADQKKQSWEKQGPSVPFLHVYGSVITWINIYSSCNPASEFTSLLLNPQCGSGELHAWHSVSMHSMWRCFRSRDYWINTSDGRCIQTTQFNLARHSD